MSAALGSQIKRFQETEQRILASPFLQLDPLLLLAGIGLIACGVYVVGTATHGDIPGNPDYYLVRQAAYGAVGLVLMLVLARFDYSRLREWKLGIYGMTIGLILLTLALGTATRGSKRWIDLPFLK
ncbi:MAG: rod shape-determining protein RodA, partial [Actinobacteria bacterium]